MKFFKKISVIMLIGLFAAVTAFAQASGGDDGDSGDGDQASNVGECNSDEVTNCSGSPVDATIDLNGTYTPSGVVEGQTKCSGGECGDSPCDKNTTQHNVTYDTSELDQALSNKEEGTYTVSATCDQGCSISGTGMVTVKCSHDFGESTTKCTAHAVANNTPGNGVVRSCNAKPGKTSYSHDCNKCGTTKPTDYDHSIPLVSVQFSENSSLYVGPKLSHTRSVDWSEVDPHTLSVGISLYCNDCNHVSDVASTSQETCTHCLKYLEFCGAHELCYCSDTCNLGKGGCAGGCLPCESCQSLCEHCGATLVEGVCNSDHDPCSCSNQICNQGLGGCNSIRCIFKCENCLPTCLHCGAAGCSSDHELCFHGDGVCNNGRAGLLCKVCVVCTECYPDYEPCGHCNSLDCGGLNDALCGDGICNFGAGGCPVGKCPPCTNENCDQGLL